MTVNYISPAQLESGAAAGVFAINEEVYDDFLVCQVCDQRHFASALAILTEQKIEDWDTSYLYTTIPPSSHTCHRQPQDGGAPSI